jgi:hypothetical protein
MPRQVAAQQLRLESSFLEAPPANENTPLSKAASASDGGRANSGPTNGAEDSPKQKHAVWRPSSAELLETPGALLTRSHLRGLGLERRAIDAVFRALPVVAIPGYSRPMIRAEQYLELVEQHTYRDDRIRPCHA